MGAVKRSVVVAVLAIAVGVTSEGAFVGQPRVAHAAPPTVTESNSAAEAAAEPVPVPEGAPSEGSAGLSPELLADPAFTASDPALADLADDSVPPPVETVADTSDPLPDSEFDIALAQAQATGQPVELESKTTETAISHVRPDGTVEVQSSAGPVRTEVDGEWVDVDITLQFTEDGVSPAAVTGDIVFSDGGSDPMVVLGDGEGTELALEWPEALPRPQLAGPVATYREVLPDVDLVLTATRTGFLQHVVVNERPDAATLRALGELQFPLSTTGGTVEETSEGQLEIRDDAGEVVGNAAPPLMWDARTDALSGEPVAVEEIGLALEDPIDAGTDATMVLSPSEEFLTDPATVYPVTIDPTTTLTSLGDTFLDNKWGAQDGQTELKVGTWNGGDQKTRSLLLFDVFEAKDRVVQNATLSLYNWHSSTCEARWIDIRPVIGGFNPTTATWANTHNIDFSRILANGNFAFGRPECPARWVDFNLTHWLQQHADRAVGYGYEMPLAVTAGNENDSATWRKFYSEENGALVPTLTWTYDGNCDQYFGNVVCGDIRAKWLSQNGADGWLGYPVTTNAPTANGRGYFNHFENGSIYWSPNTGAHFIRGQILAEYEARGAAGGRHGFPVRDEECTLRNGGCYVTLEGGSIHFSPMYGAYTTWGQIREKWAQKGWETSYLGYPVSDETCGQKDQGCYQDFERGSILYSPATGAHNVQGAIRDRYNATAGSGQDYRGHRGYLGYPITDETCGLRDGGCYVAFQNGSIHYSPATGAWDTTGAIRKTWADLGWETGWLGYPTSGTLAVAGGARSEFQGGNIVYDSRTGATVVGAGTLTHPTQFQRVTQARTQLKATVKVRPGGSSYEAVQFQWRPYSLTPSEGWLPIDAGTLRQPDQSAVTETWLPLTDTTSGGGKESAVYTWNATASIPTDGLAQVRACLRIPNSSEVRCTGVTQITVDRAGLTGANATADVGPGTVSLLTGAYSVTGRDAEVTAPHGGLAATRTFASNAPGRAGPLGPGWGLSLAVDEAGADYASLTDRTETVLITRGDGTQLPFVRANTATPDRYVAEGEASTEGAVLTFVQGTAPAASTYVLTDLDGDKVTFTRADGGNGHLNDGLFRVTKVEAIRGKAGSTDLAPAVTTVTYTAAGNPRLLLAPTDAGAACPDPTTTAQPAGCRALEFVYTGTGAGERLQTIRLWAHGAVTPAGGLVTGDTPVGPQTVTLASYSYDGGRLAGVTDPRSGLTVAYTYRSDGRLATITPAGGTAVWTLGYDDRSLPRLATATLDDRPDTGLAPQQTTVRYDVPRDGVGTLPDLRRDAVARWGQTTVPTDLTAVFGPATVPDATPTEGQWRGATLHALDVNGRVVNTAGYGGTADQDTGADLTPAWRITTTEYDTEGRGNVVRSLTAGNRERALAAGTDTAVQAAQAKLLDSVNVYSADGRDLLRAYGPTRRVTPAGGGQPVAARTRTTTAYDTGKEPGHPTPNVSRHLPVRTTVDAVAITAALPAGSTGNDPALPALDGQQRVTVLEYGDANVNANAWKFGTPTASRVLMSGGGEVVTRQTVDEQGRTTTSTLPNGGTSTATAATTRTVYYAATSTEPGCTNAAWAGWVCKTLPGGTPPAGSPLLTKHVTGYDVYGNPTRVVETGQGVARATDTAYDAAGRARRSGTTGSGTEIGQLRPVVETTYTAAGLVEQTRLLNPDGTVGGSTAQGTGPISRSYDAYGRLTNYTDGTGLNTTYSYDTVGRLSTVNNEEGTRTVTYDGDGERGSLPTRIEVSDVGVFTARYGADGTLVSEGLPGGMNVTTVRDSAGDAISLSYSKTTTGGTAEWLRSTATVTGFDEVDSYRLAAATGLTRSTRHTYDSLGRLATVTESATGDANGRPTGATCTRQYGFDANSNRLSLTQAASTGAPAGTCPATVAASDNYGYDTADRLLPGGARGTLRYDAVGRTRVLPSVDTVGQGGDVALDYYVDDLVATMTQAGKITTFGLDAAARRTMRTDTDTTSPGVARRTVSRYSGDDDNPDVVVEPDNSRTRNVLGFGGLAAIVTRSGTAGAEVKLQLANLHGDVTATVPASAVDPGDVAVTETLEYGQPRIAPMASTQPSRYGWLGTHQRDASTPGGLTLMGVRLYTPALGRFLSVDPIYGGSANAYEYANGDPIGHFDLDGRRSMRDMGGAFAGGRGGTGSGYVGGGRGYRPIKYRAYTARNARINLGRRTGGTRAGYDAHHVFPQAHRAEFARRNINIHDPRYLVWWKSGPHRSAAAAYNRAWGNFLQTNPSRSEVLQFGRVIMREYGIGTSY